MTIVLPLCDEPGSNPRGAPVASAGLGRHEHRVVEEKPSRRKAEPRFFTRGGVSGGTGAIPRAEPTESLRD